MLFVHSIQIHFVEIKIFSLLCAVGCRVVCAFLMISPIQCNLVVSFTSVHFRNCAYIVHTHRIYNYIYANAHRITFNMDTNLKHVHNLNKTVLNVLWQHFTCFVLPPTPMTDFVCVVMKTQRTDCVLKCKFTQLTHVLQWYYSDTIQYHSNAYIKCVYAVHLRCMYYVLYCIVLYVHTPVCIAYVLTANVISAMLRYSKIYVHHAFSAIQRIIVCIWREMDFHLIWLRLRWLFPSPTFCTGLIFIPFNYLVDVFVLAHNMCIIFSDRNELCTQIFAWIFHRNISNVLDLVSFCLLIWTMWSQYLLSKMWITILIFFVLIFSVEKSNKLKWQNMNM